MIALQLGLAYRIFNGATVVNGSSDPAALPGRATQITWQTTFNTG